MARALFEQGKSGNPNGRPKGSPNKLTKTVRGTVLSTFNKLQEDKEHNLEAFAKKYPRDFYTIASKLIPTEIRGTINTSDEIDYSKLSDAALDEIINASIKDESESREV